MCPMFGVYGPLDAVCSGAEDVGCVHQQKRKEVVSPELRIPDSPFEFRCVQQVPL